MSANDKRIREIVRAFDLAGEYCSCDEIHSGHINSTYVVEFSTGDTARTRYVFQRINTHVFKDPHAVMSNVAEVTRHMTEKISQCAQASSAQSGSVKQSLKLYSTHSGEYYHTDCDGEIWRCYNCIDGCLTYDIVQTTHQAYQAARAFGAFQNHLSDLPVEKVSETIPDFHNTPKRYDRLMEVAALDPVGRVKFVKDEINFVRSHKLMVSTLLKLRDSGHIPERITHNDTKINNVMMDAQTDDAVCVIDLDTVMPGLALYDFGDLIRTAVSPAAEDECDLSKVTVRMPIFKALVEGYLSACGSLTDAEINHLAFAGKLISLEVGIRFLTDYLEGDIYFKTNHANHSLDRARNQFKLVGEIEAREEEMQEFVASITQKSC